MTTIELKAASTALVLIDLQQGIVARTGAPYSTTDVVTRCAGLSDTFHAAKALVVYVRVDMTNMVKVEVDAPAQPAPPAGATDLVTNAGFKEGDLVVTKRHWSALINTDLEQQLRAHHIDTIVLGGISTNIGVDSTARDAAALGLNVVFAEDAMTSMAADQHDYAIKVIFPRIGRVRSTKEISLV